MQLSSRFAFPPVRPFPHVHVAHLDAHRVVHDPVHDAFGVGASAHPPVPILDAVLRVGRIMSPVFRAKDAATARAMYHVACDMLRACCPRAADVAEEAEPDALAYLGFPPSHWKRLRTNNVQERANREIKRRSRVVQVFPSEKSLERLVGAVMCEQDEAWSQSRYFSYDKIQELYDKKRAAAPAATGKPGELAEEARKMILASLELAEKVETA